MSPVIWYVIESRHAHIVGGNVFKVLFEVLKVEIGWYTNPLNIKVFFLRHFSMKYKKQTVELKKRLFPNE